MLDDCTQQCVRRNAWRPSSMSSGDNVSVSPTDYSKLLEGSRLNNILFHSLRTMSDKPENPAVNSYRGRYRGEESVLLPTDLKSDRITQKSSLLKFFHKNICLDHAKLRQLTSDTIKQLTTRNEALTHEAAYPLLQQDSFDASINKRSAGLKDSFSLDSGQSHGKQVGFDLSGMLELKLKLAESEHELACERQINKNLRLDLIKLKEDNVDTRTEIKFQEIKIQQLTKDFHAEKAKVEESQSKSNDCTLYEGKVQSIQETLQETVREKDEMQKNEEDLKCQNETLVAEINTLRSQLEGSQLVINQKLDLIHKLKEENQALQTELQNESEKSELINEELAKKSIEVSTMHCNVSSLEVKNDEMASQVENLKSQLSEAELQLKERSESKGSLVRKFKEKEMAAKAELAKVKRELSSTQSKQGAKVKELRGMMDRFLLLADRYEVIVGEVQQLRRKVSISDTNADEANRSLVLIQEELKQKERDANEKIESVSSELKETKRELSSKNAELSKTAKQLHKAENEVSSLRKRVERRDNEISTLRKKCDSVKDAHKESESKLKRAPQSPKETVSGCQDAVKLSSDATSELQALKKELRYAHEKLVELATENNRLCTNSRQSRNEKDALQKMSKASEETSAGHELEVIQKELMKAQEKINELKTEVNCFKVENNRLCTNNRQLRNEKDTLQKMSKASKETSDGHQLKVVEKELMKAQEKNNWLKTEINCLKVENEQIINVKRALEKQLGEAETNAVNAANVMKITAGELDTALGDVNRLMAEKSMLTDKCAELEEKLQKTSTKEIRYYFENPTVNFRNSVSFLRLELQFVMKYYISYMFLEPLLHLQKKTSKGPFTRSDFKDPSLGSENWKQAFRRSDFKIPFSW